MEDVHLGWITAIIVGGLAGWAAQYVMKSQTKILLDVVLGVIGSALANFLLGFFGINFSGLVGYLIAGFIGACILIWIGRRINKYF
ncbi:GlsB/YeaQ/YmgE family stress response membrane protein [Bartonella sp. CB175]|uniref:GlsB/YeaQ/YmgE family stress response membrane protein n=1 Tax=Bartonella sp. CB175 TaxID=3112256 RepID=UPI00300E6CFD